MSEIKKYKKYLNFKANPRYLTRDFMVPLYTGTEFNISDDKTAEAFTNFARENDPEGFKKIQKIVDDINNKNTLEEFDIKDREPNANGGIAGLL